jgi:hypothetical protein
MERFNIKDLVLRGNGVKNGERVAKNKNVVKLYIIHPKVKATPPVTVNPAKIAKMALAGRLISS